MPHVAGSSGKLNEIRLPQIERNRKYFARGGPRDYFINSSIETPSPTDFEEPR